MTKLTAALATCVLTLGLTACGSDPGPEETVEDFHQSLVQEDFEGFCDTLAPDLVDPLEEAAGGATCAEVMEQNGEGLFGELDEDAEIDIVDSEVSEDGESAVVTFTVGDNPEEQLSLVQIEDEWKIGSLEEESADS